MQTIQHQDDRIKRLEAENANLKVENRSLIKSASLAIQEKGHHIPIDEGRRANNSCNTSVTYKPAVTTNFSGPPEEEQGQLNQTLIQIDQLKEDYSKLGEKLVIYMDKISNLKS